MQRRILAPRRQPHPLECPDVAADSYSWRSIWTAAVTGLVLIVIACGVQAAFAPTVRVSCPARSAGAPDCEMRWLVAFDRIPLRTTALPGLRSADEVEESNPNGGSTGPRRGTAGAYTVYLQTAAGRVRTIMWGNQMELQHFREPIVKYLENAQSAPLDVTMWPSSHPMRKVTNGIVVVALLFWVWLPVQIVGLLRRAG
jgi:hypothetical protein